MIRVNWNTTVEKLKNVISYTQIELIQKCPNLKDFVDIIFMSQEEADILKYVIGNHTRSAIKYDAIERTVRMECWTFNDSQTYVLISDWEK
jgi:hypothetical protein